MLINSVTPFIVDFPIKNGDFNSYVKLPEGNTLSKITMNFSVATREGTQMNEPSVTSPGDGR